MLDVRLAQTAIENALRDAILFALGARLAQVASVAALRAVPTQGTVNSQFHNDRLITVAGSPLLSYRWNQESTIADNGVSVVKPNDVTANGRWLQWTSPVRFSPSAGANSTTLDQIASGYLQRVIVLDRDFAEDEWVALLTGAVPAVLIQAEGDSPKDLTQNTGHRWDRAYRFRVWSLDQNLRGRREAAQGSLVSGDTTIGANAVDGLVEALISGTSLNAVVDGIRNIQSGDCENRVSELAENRVVRVREYTVQATVELPQAPNESLSPQTIAAQAHLDSLDSSGDAFDPANYVANGMLATVALGLTQPVAAGSAQIAGVTVSYAGSAGQAFPAWSDTYHDLLNTGVMTFTSVARDTAPPAVAANALRVAVTTTNTGAVIQSAYTAATSQILGSQFLIPV